MIESQPPLHVALPTGVAAVEASGERLHYAAKVDVAAGTVEVGPQACNAEHPFNHAGGDNMVSITTNFYAKPLVVQGAGAGGDVTASGVLTDVLRIADGLRGTRRAGGRIV